MIQRYKSRIVVPIKNKKLDIRSSRVEDKTALNNTKVVSVYYANNSIQLLLTQAKFISLMIYQLKSKT